jgi:hypothetical protein
MGRGLRAALLVVIGVGGCGAATFTVTKTQEELQARLAPRFPITREKYLVAVTLSDPKVLLRTEDNRVGLDLATEVRAPRALLTAPLAGRIAVMGVPYYDPQQKAFFLHDPRIERVDFPGFDLARYQKARLALEAAVGLALQSIPVYTLEGRTFKEATAKHLLKEVHVEAGKLHFTLGP